MPANPKSDNPPAQQPSTTEKISIDDLQLPKAILARIAKNVLPEGTAVQKEAKTALGNAATVFISYLTAVATDFMKKASHKTIQANDIFEALKVIEMEEHVPQLQELFDGYKAVQQSKRAAAKAKANSASTNASPSREEASKSENAQPTGEDEDDERGLMDDLIDDADPDATEDGEDEADDEDTEVEETETGDVKMTEESSEKKQMGDASAKGRPSQGGVKRKLGDQELEADVAKRMKGESTDSVDADE